MCGAMVPGTVVFAAAYGTLAAQKGLTLGEAVLMSTLVYGGASQLVGLEVWTNPVTLSTLISLAIVTAVVNARFILMGATLRPWLGTLPSWQAYAITQRHRRCDLARRGSLSRREGSRLLGFRGRRIDALGRVGRVGRSGISARRVHF